LRVVVQRVSKASVSVDGAEVASIGRGLLILLGVANGDAEEDSEWLANKVCGLRIFPNDDGHMNHSVKDICGQALVVSQFTLIASTKKGTRPSFNDAAKPDVAIPLDERFVATLEALLASKVATGTFGAMMAVSLVNDGPVTITIDSRNRE
jgi:D-tyrosyl-tRNA(Tyr) deacylase